LLNRLEKLDSAKVPSPEELTAAADVGRTILEICKYLQFGKKKE